MLRFRILYLSNVKSEAFRLKPPRTAPNVLRRSHYVEGPEITASSPYEAWSRMREQSMAGSAEGARPLAVGDALETGDRLLVFNYWGFEAAEWWEPSRVKSSAKGGSRKGRGGHGKSRARA